MNPEFLIRKRSHVVTVDHVPTWASAGDVIEQRGQRTMFVSATLRERRWRKLARWLSRLLIRKVKGFAAD